MSNFTCDEKEYDTKIGFNIVQKNKNSKKMNTTFVTSCGYKKAIQTVLKVKGGFNKIINILSIREYDRELGQVNGNLISAHDKDGIICKIKGKYNM